MFSRTIIFLGLLGLCTTVAFPQEESPHTDSVTSEAAKLEIKVEQQNPWTNLEFPNSTRNFQFTVVADGAGSVEQLNLLHPEFAVSVGNQIEHETESPEEWGKQWAEFESAIGKLKMPYFYCVGERDVPNASLAENWNRKFGRSYYSFRYQDVLFLILNTEDLPGEGSPYQIGTAQQSWTIEQLNNNRDARWTFVVIHQPTWTFTKKEHHPGKLGWESIEDALQGRNYTVFAGHKGEFARYERNGMEYYHIGNNMSTDGDADRSPELGERARIIRVTMEETGPVMGYPTADGQFSTEFRTLPDPKREK